MAKHLSNRLWDNRWVARLAVGVGAFWLSCSTWAAEGDGETMAAPAGAAGGTIATVASPMSDYTASAVIYVLLIGVLVATLLIGGLLILNLGLMSKRSVDRRGGIDPSDVDILRTTVWPEEEARYPVLPAMDEAANPDPVAERMAERKNDQVVGENTKRAS